MENVQNDNELYQELFSFLHFTSLKSFEKINERQAFENIECSNIQMIRKDLCLMDTSISFLLVRLQSNACTSWSKTVTTQQVNRTFSNYSLLQWNRSLVPAATVTECHIQCYMHVHVPRVALNIYSGSIYTLLRSYNRFVVCFRW